MHGQNRLIQEVIAEVRWLSQRQAKSNCKDCLSNNVNVDCAFPSAMPILGFPGAAQFINAAKCPTNINDAQGRPNLGTDESVCITEEFVTPKNENYSRQRPKWAALIDLMDEFGDEVEANIFNPFVAVQVMKAEKEGINDSENNTSKKARWLCHPFENSTLSFKIMTAATEKSTVISLLGDPAPLSPVIQPQLQFHLKRNKRRTCHLHFEQHASVKYHKSFDRSVHQAAIDLDEPLSSPPLCSCPNEELLTSYHNILDPFQINEMDPQDEESKRLISEADEFLHKQGICHTCGGLHYFPFSTFELLLTHDVTTLMDFCEKYPLPPNTDVYCDGPKISACIVTKSAAHEWEVFKSLIAVKCYNFSIHDFCSIHFWPGTQVSDFYWSKAASSCQRSSQMESKNKSTIANESSQNSSISSYASTTPVICAGESTPLAPPAQFLLNIRNLKPSTWSSPISSLSARALRRPYCVRRRNISELEIKAAIASVDPTDLDQVESIHERAVTSPELESLMTENSKLKFQLAAVTKELQGLREEFLALKPQAQRESG